MDPDGLKAALLPVAGYFKATKVTQNSVLAAYMRREGLAPTGVAWSKARASMDAGMTFEEAVADLTNSPHEAGSHVDDAAGRQEAYQSPDDSDPDGGDSKRGDDVPPLSSPTLSSSRGNLQEQLPARSSDFEEELPVLTWYPKPTGLGDMDGEGLQRILGMPAQDNLSVLVRETVQNSWDARQSGEKPEFWMHLRTLPSSSREILRKSVFSDLDALPKVLPISGALEKQPIEVLEINDRGTSGLDGPIRNDLALETTEPERFANLIFNVGATAGVPLSGGTYGFGKVATYRMSRCRTVIFWTRCWAESGADYRFIAVSLGPRFVINGKRHTGHHWWGMPAVDLRIEPVVGADAEKLGRSIFATGFRDDELGTSIMILDPALDESNSETKGDRIVDAIKTNLWPKYLSGGTFDSLPPMEIGLRVEDKNIDWQSPNDELKFKHMANCLESLRAVQDGRPNPGIQQGVIVEEVWCWRPKKLLGHLALVQYMPSPTESDTDRDFDSTIALMRNEAELVVKYEKHMPSPHPDLKWCGVFKPNVETDTAFAAAEPPAHDDWLPESLENSIWQTWIRTAAKRRIELVQRFLQPLIPPVEGDGAEKKPTGVLAESLGWLAPQRLVANKLVGEASTRGSVSSGRRRRSVEVQITRIEPIELTASKRRAVRVSTKVEAPNGVSAWVIPVLRAITEDSSEELNANEVAFSWEREGTAAAGEICLADGQEASLIIEFPSHLALKIDFKTEVET